MRLAFIYLPSKFILQRQSVSKGDMSQCLQCKTKKPNKKLMSHFICRRETAIICYLFWLPCNRKFSGLLLWQNQKIYFQKIRKKKKWEWRRWGSCASFRITQRGVLQRLLPTGHGFISYTEHSYLLKCRTICMRNSQLLTFCELLIVPLVNISVCSISYWLELMFIVESYWLMGWKSGYNSASGIIAHWRLLFHLQGQ